MARSNIILIVAECQRWDSLNAFGNTDLRRANLDALATHGLTFPLAVASALTPPAARATLLTGAYPHVHRVFDTRDPIRIPALPRLLSEAGYHTAGVGVLPPCLLSSGAGFDAVRPLGEEPEAAGRAVSYAAWLRDQGDEACQRSLAEKLHPVTWVGDHAVRFLQRAEEPFFLYVSFPGPGPDTAPPFPWDRLYDAETLALPQGWCARPTPDDERRLREAGIDSKDRTEEAFRRTLAAYYGSLSHVDKQVGRLLATLTARGFTRNLIVYTSAQGAAMGQHGLWYNETHCPYDTNIRVPLLVAGLAGQRRGMADASLVESVDVAPTILREAEIRQPGSVQGRILTPALYKRGEPVRRAAVSEGPSGIRVVRSSRYKVVLAPHENQCMLHDLERDPHEFVNEWNNSGLAQVRNDLVAEATISEENTQ